MYEIKIFIIYEIISFLENGYTSYIVSGICGQPSSPKNSNFYPQKELYLENDLITYFCSDLVTFTQQRKCVHGNWSKPNAICGNK